MNRVSRLAVFSLLMMIPFRALLAQKKNDIRVIAYFSGSLNQLDSIDLGKITHIIYCFGHLDGHRLNIGNANDTAKIKKMVGLKSRRPELKVILSMGGWGGCENCSDGFFTPEGRQEFANSVKQATDYFHTDGIDLDWEYPTIRLDNDIDKNPVHKVQPEDKANFSDLVRRLRTTLDPATEISFAAGGFNTYLKGSVDWKTVVPLVSYVNLMSYDIINGYATETGHHTALFSNPHQSESTDNAVQYLLGIGVDPNKIIIGAAFYARVWKNVPDTSHGLYQPGSFSHGIDYKDFSTRLSQKAGFESYWDETTRAPYSYNKKDHLFATYDDKRSIRAKTEYVFKNHLGGIMFWEISGDSFKNGLVGMIDETRKKLMQ